VGLFAVHALQSLPGAVITSVEPDPFNVPFLNRCIDLNQAGEHWTLITACAAAKEGVVPFAAGRYADSRIVAEAQADTIDLPSLDVFPLINVADIVKMDIEGGEWHILLDPRFQTVTPAVFVVEWHRYQCRHHDARSTVAEAFMRAGYKTQMSPPSQDTFGHIWAWRSDYGVR
jgi:FkbM family methyltransferase